MGCINWCTVIDIWSLINVISSQVKCFCNNYKIRLYENEIFIFSNSFWTKVFFKFIEPEPLLIDLFGM